MNSVPGLCGRNVTVPLNCLAKAHDRLNHGSSLELMDIWRYIEEVCTDLDASVSRYEIHTDA